MTTVNLITNYHFESSTTGWSANGGSGGTLAVSSLKSRSGAQSLLLTSGGSPVFGLYTDNGSAHGIPVVKNRTYTFTIYILDKDTSGSYRPFITWYDSTDTAISSVYMSYYTSLSTTTWSIASFSAVAPATAAYAKVGIAASSTPTSGKAIYLDDAIFYETMSQDQETSAVNASLGKLYPGDPETKPYITGLKLQSDISINGLVLNSIDKNNVVWVCTDIDGWWNLSDVELPDVSRGLLDGSYDVKGRRQPRMITLKGSVLPPKSSFLAEARSTLLKALDLVYVGGWLLVDESPIKSAYVKLASKPEITVVNARGRIDFTVQLKAVDPLKYSWDGTATDGFSSSTIPVNTISGTTTVDVTNAGNVDVSTVIKITGPMQTPAYIKNTTTDTYGTSTDQTIKVVTPLRAAGYSVTTVSAVQVVSGIATVYTVADHGFLVGDVVTLAVAGTSAYLNGNKTITAITSKTFSFSAPSVGVVTASLSSPTVTVTTSSAHGWTTGVPVYLSGLGVPYDGSYTLASGSGTTFTYTRAYSATALSYEGTATRELSYSTSYTGTAVLTSADTLEIDTYNGTILYRGLPTAARGTLDPKIDLIKLKSGVNKLKIQQSSSVTATATIKYKSGWIG